MCLFKGWKSLKNLKVGVFETDFKPVPFVFHRTTCTYSESWGPVENLCDTPVPWGARWVKNDRKTEKMTEKNFLCQNFFPLILPKKHCLITQNRFWPFFGILSGFLGIPRTIYFSCLSLYFNNFFTRNTVGS